MLTATYGQGSCPRPDKQRYLTEAEAQLAADYIFDTHDQGMDPYHCPCGLWHLTTPIGERGRAKLGHDAPGQNGTKAARMRRWIQPDRGWSPRRQE